jgi:large subunit ribosomal protein L6
MSRLASKPIVLNAGVACAIEGSNIKITQGNKSKLFPFSSNYLNVKIEGNSVLLSRREDVKTPVSLRGLLGTTWALFKQALKDLAEGYKAKLNFVGVGYKAQVVKAGGFNYLRITVGFSHPIFVFIPNNITVAMDKETAIVSGEDTQTVMQFCAKVRAQKKPTAYHGTGVIMNNEVIIKKVGKKK